MNFVKYTVLCFVVGMVVLSAWLVYVGRPGWGLFIALVTTFWQLSAMSEKWYWEEVKGKKHGRKNT